MLFRSFTAQKIACVSATTYHQLIDLQRRFYPSRECTCRVIYNGFNDTFHRISEDQVKIVLKDFKLDDIDYFLHVGSGLPRKNRFLLIRLLQALKDESKVEVVFAGADIDNEMRKLIKLLNVEGKVHVIVKPTHEQLLAIYSGAYAFIFPSYAEGFGWPVIEAQACGTPVIASNIQPMPEIGGEGALYAHPDNVNEFVDCVKRVREKNTRLSLINKGYQNIQRFGSQQMICQYIELLQS